MAKTPLFLERRSYRRRRIMDGLRMLPFLCALLWVVVPIMWPNGADPRSATALSSALWYIFAIWVLAITASFALWRRLRDTDTDKDADHAVQGGPAVSDR